MGNKVKIIWATYGSPLDICHIFWRNLSKDEKGLGKFLRDYRILCTPLSPHPHHCHQFLHHLLLLTSPTADLPAPEGSKSPLIHGQALFIFSSSLPVQLCGTVVLRISGSFTPYVSLCRERTREVSQSPELHPASQAMAPKHKCQQCSPTIGLGYKIIKV